ncbi:hypothetical protein CVT25_001569 [Psilocybe cyanescens]|uniref:Uncharacterized protein n=1 Tax=Psilocybe cyanescens TaxID=93625 RepID=A0A409WQ32_PSICY|nr:hypothetical protein CVT25_001569 [Psilocybe cyanescens]
MAENTTRSWRAAIGTVYPDARRIFVTEKTSTIVQFRHIDYGMEKCSVIYSIPSLTATFNPSANVHASTIIDVWNLETVGEISRHIGDTWKYASPRKEKLGSINISVLLNLLVHQVAQDVISISGKINVLNRRPAYTWFRNRRIAPSGYAIAAARMAYNDLYTLWSMRVDRFFRNLSLLDMQPVNAIYKLAAIVLAFAVMANSTPVAKPAEMVDCDAEDIAARGLALCF